MTEPSGATGNNQYARYFKILISVIHTSHQGLFFLRGLFHIAEKYRVHTIFSVTESS